MPVSHACAQAAGVRLPDSEYLFVFGFAAFIPYVREGVVGWEVRVLAWGWYWWWMTGSVALEVRVRTRSP